MSTPLFLLHPWGLRIGRSQIISLFQYKVTAPCTQHWILYLAPMSAVFQHKNPYWSLYTRPAKSVPPFTKHTLGTSWPHGTQSIHMSQWSPADSPASPGQSINSRESYQSFPRNKSRCQSGWMMVYVVLFLLLSPSSFFFSRHSQTKWRKSWFLDVLLDHLTREGFMKLASDI